MQNHFDNLATPIPGGGLTIIAGASVTVTDSLGNLAVIYSDDGVTTQLNPMTTDDLGYYSFFAPDGRYTLTYSGNFTSFDRTILLEGLGAGTDLVLAQLGAPSGAVLVRTVAVGAATEERDLQDKGRDIIGVKDFTGITEDNATDCFTGLQNALDSKEAVFNAAGYAISAALKFPSLAKVRGKKAGIAFIGNTANVKHAVRKTTNATVAITNFQTEVVSNIDCIGYLDPAWIDAGVSYPQKLSIESMAFQGHSPAPNTTGFYIEQGGGLTFRDLDFCNVVNAIYAKEAWLCVFDRVHALASFVWKGGTSVTMNNCWTGKGDVAYGVYGGYDFTSLSYSTLNSCASDGAYNTAYRFHFCKLTLNSCGCEGATTQTGNSGTAIAFDGGNEIVLNNFNCVPTAAQAIPVYTVGANEMITFNGGNCSFGVSTACADLYVWGNGSTVIFNDHTFVSGARNTPVIQFASGITTSKVIVNSGATRTTYTSNGAGATVTEVDVDSGTFTPAVTFGGTAVGMTYGSRSGTWQKNGKVVTVSGRLALSAKGSSTGAAQISGWPSTLVPIGDVQVNFSLVSSITGGPISALIDAGTTTATLLLRGATGDSSAADGNLSNTTALRFTFTFTVA